MTKIKRIILIITTLALILLPARAEELYDWLFDEAATVPPTATPGPTPKAPSSRLKDDGILRVWLKSLEDPEEMHLTLCGSYALEGNGGFYFTRDAELTLAAADGAIWLSSGGITVDMGTALTLTRHAVAEGSLNGLYIAESERHALYCGDLSVHLTAAGGLRCTLDIQVEDYLPGVVAYEMSDSWPVEALKAQAVAARTYAMQRKWSAGKRGYDLVDTTADQVYKGYDPEYMNVYEAVTATRGLVCTWDGAFATCYYTASNGGQTALPSQIWGNAVADAYLAMADDPYDLENPSSIVNDLTFTPECEGSVKLRQMLEDALSDVMADEGFDDWRLDAIAAITPIDPRFEGSYLYERLAFDLIVMVPESALQTPAPTATADANLAPTPERWVALPDTRRVTLGVFDDIKDGLSMGINSTDCELISVETATDAKGNPTSFTLAMRRYGHGVGMSQRGAQCMAGDHGMTCLEILAFYYPGAKVERIKWPDQKLTAVEDLPAAVGAERPEPTPTPSPAPLPKLQKGEHYATVNATSLNVRQNPTTAAIIVDVLDQGRKVVVSGPADSDGWVPIKTGDVTGYVKEEYLD